MAGPQAARRASGGRFRALAGSNRASFTIKSITSDNATLSDIHRSRQARRFRSPALGESAAIGYPSGMLARGDSLAIQVLPAASPAAFPAWARAENPPESDAEAAFLAGAALARLDAIVRENPPWAGVWRRRLALERRRGERRAAPAAPRTRRRCATRSISPGRAPIPDPRDGVSLAWRELVRPPGRALAFVFRRRRRRLGGPA